MLIRIAGILKDALFPARCLVCGSFLYHTPSPHIDFVAPGVRSETSASFEKLMDPFLCNVCSAGFQAIESPLCPRCGIMFKSREGEDHICGDCITRPKKFTMARSYGVYDRALMAAIHCMKYRGKIQLARPLGILLFATYVRYWSKRALDFIIPVPLHSKRMRMRGFNQAFLLIRNWRSMAEKLDIKLPEIHVDRDILLRKRWIEPQTGLSRRQRLKNIRNAFTLDPSKTISGKRILLVDDVYTTGATVNECAKVLLNGGALSVDVLTLAQTA